MMPRARANLTRIILILLLLSPVRVALADGKIFSIGTLEPARIPDQRALLCFDGRTETLVIDTRFTATPGEAAWVVPLPAPPEIEPVTEGLFPTLDALFATRVHRESGPGLAPPLAVISIALLLALLAPRRRWATWGVALVTVVLVFGCLLPSLGRSRRGIDDPGVRVFERRLVGVFDTAVLAGDSPEAVLRWLRDNGFTTPAGVEPVIADYLADGWVFVAARLDSDSDASSGEPRTPHPLAFRFETPEPVYPLRLTGVGNGELAVDLFVFAGGRASIPGWRTEMALPVERHDPLDGPVPIGRDFDEPIIVAHPELARLTAALRFATRLSATLPESAMRTDARIAIGPPLAHQPPLYTRPAASKLGVESGLLMLVLGLGVVYAVRLVHGWSRRRALAGACLVLAFAIAFVPGVQLVVRVVDDGRLAPNRHPWLLSSLHRGVAFELYQEADADPSITRDRAEARALELLGAEAAERDLAPPALRDAPGDFTIRENADGSMDYVMYDRVGTPIVVNWIVPPPAADSDAPAPPP